MTLIISKISSNRYKSILSLIPQQKSKLVFEINYTPMKNLVCSAVLQTLPKSNLSKTSKYVEYKTVIKSQSSYSHFKYVIRAHSSTSESSLPALLNNMLKPNQVIKTNLSQFCNI